MGMSSFNRMRREKAKVEVIEAERFKIVNGAGGIRAQDEARAKADELLPAAEEAQIQANINIGEKTLSENDEALRQDHAAEIAGRNIEGVQGDPIDPVQRVLNRVPDGTANEALVPFTNVEGKGPSKALLQAAAEETGSVGIITKTVPDADPNAPNMTGAEEGDGDDDNDNNEEDDNAEDKANAEIPDGWEELNASDMRALASNFTPRKVHTKNEAKIVINREVRRREEEASKIEVDPAADPSV